MIEEITGIVLYGPRPITDTKEARLVALLTECGDEITAARKALTHPTRSMLLPEYRRLEKKLEMARVECAIAIARLREYRKRRLP